MRQSIDIASRKAELESRLASLDGRIHEIEHELESHNDRNWSEAALEREGDEVLERQGSAAQTEMVAIRAALSRIEAGEYGFCVKCGAEIEAARLDLIPYAPLCAACAGAGGR